MVCPTCHGSGTIKCNRCNGKGYFSAMFSGKSENCKSCGGAGKLQCPNCGGTGRK